MNIIHTADLHLGASLLGLDAVQSNMRKDELAQTFLRLLDYAAAHGTDALLIVGDLFDNTHPTPALLREISAAIAACPTQVFFVTGNHDDGVIFPAMPDNFHRFENGWRTYAFGDVTVTGADWRFVGPGLNELQLPEDRLNFLLLHGEVRRSVAVGKGQVDISRLQNKHVDYLALGHLHGVTPFQPLDGRGGYRYSGCLEGHGFDECGEKGFIQIETDGRKIKQTFVPFATRRYVECTVDVSGISSSAELEKKTRALLSNAGGRDGVKVLLKGDRAQDSALRTDRLQRALSQTFFQTAVIDESIPSVDEQRYLREKSLKGEIVRLALEKVPDETERAQVLSLAFRALSGDDLDV